jgi:phytoene dehydrogenase-like protein
MELGVEEENFPGAAACLSTMLEGGEELIKANDNKTAREFLLEYTDDEQFHRFNSMMALLMFAIPYHVASAGEYIYCFNAMFGGAAYGYPIGGANAIPAAYVKGLEKHGGRLHLGKGVKRIVVENNRAVGAQTADGFIPADIVISNVGLQLTVSKLVGESFFSADYVNYVKSLINSDGVVAIRYALNKRIIEEPFFFYIPKESSAGMFRFLREKNGMPDDPLFFIPVPSNWDEKLALPGKQVVISATICRNELDSNYKDIIEFMDRRFREMWPEIENHIVWRDLSGPKEIAAVTGKNIGECIGLAQIPGQVGDHRPKAMLPIENLFAVGADIEGRGIGTDMAVDSAIKVNNKIF